MLGRREPRPHQLGGRYAGPTLRELCQDMRDHLRSARLVDLLDTAFQDLPEPVAPPQSCYQRLVRGGTHRVRPADAPGQVAAAMVTVTPPGIPVLMPGEAVGAADGPLLRYLGALEAFDRRFPGFRSETHGVTVDPGPATTSSNACARRPTAHPHRATRAAAPRRPPSAAARRTAARRGAGGAS
ncbi:hypothetical protein [Streptomyces asoensis]|uniref:Orn/Lys/Arg family decarboxylase n=1 Tax=Streptomyces asoensis TaxID=249586 RepID=UPI003F4CD638